MAAINSPSLWWKAFPKPSDDGHKYDRGHALVLSGGAAQTGGARLAAQAALRVGAGLVTVMSPPSAVIVNASHLTAVMLRAVADADELAAVMDDQRITCAIAGPALGFSKTARAKVDALLRCRQKLVLDADALTMHAEASDAFFSKLGSHGLAVLTPHEGEFKRLFPDLDGPREARAAHAAKRSGAVVTLKGAETIVASPKGSIVRNEHATPWLATAGSGDVLAGVIGGLMAQGMEPFDAACAGVWLHGDAGRRCGPALISEDLDAGLRRSLAALFETPPT
ncbi:NAD(P)H-hydrate dehydratase [Pseudahrensia aquimaris]|uniref:ADP-dependent (S)-NAD(P)H-hydrate dehydratase n=1 Tax=Pseudahrensia aquimaris TaxID=744461 RepID=A0ABW3FG16_9HYPH